MTIHPTTNLTKDDEFQIKTAPRLDLPLLRIGKGVITDHIDFSFMNNEKEYYEEKFVVYSQSLSRKHKSLIKHAYEHLGLKELTKLKLTIDEGLVANLTCFRTCAACDKECYQEKDIVKCRTCTCWIHDDASCYKYNKQWKMLFQL